MAALGSGFTIGTTLATRRHRMDAELASARERERHRREQRDYAAARLNRLSADWVTSILSADQSIKGDLTLLRGASRALVRDNSYASRYGQMLAENVIGEKGIQLQSMLSNTRGAMNKKANRQLEDAWLEWGFRENASADGRQSFVDLQGLGVKTLPADGEYCFRILRGYDNPFLFALEPLDVDLLDVNYSGISERGNEVRMGVEVSKYGRPLGYWMWTRHPSDTGSLSNRRERVFVDANDIIHDYAILRPQQSRGVPWFTPVLIDQKMLQGYQEAEITAARWGASNMAAVNYDAEKAGGGFSSARPGADVIPSEVEPGRLLRLGPGESLASTNFDHPSTAFGPFTKAIQRSIATGLNVAYTSLTGDLEAVNYSSIRAGLIGERDFYRMMQAWYSAGMCRRTFRAWVPCAILAGKLPGLAIDKLLGPRATKWRGRGWQWVDPRNDIEAAQLEIALGINSRTNIMGERGRDYEETIDDLAHENEVADEAGVAVNPTGLTVTGEVTPPGDTSKPGDTSSGEPPADTSNGASDASSK